MSGISRPPRGTSPFRLNLDQQRTRAKELLAGLRAGEPGAVGRFHRHHPRGAAAGRRLSEAQLVVAREMGLPSWTRLKAHVEAADRSRAHIAAGGPAPDAGARTLHIRCGSDIRPVLAQAGFTGDFLEYADPLCQGPVLPGPGWLDARAAFVADAYGRDAGQTREEVGTTLGAAEAGLHAAAERHERVVLWFEHDSYDQLVLARCLAAFAARRPARLDLVSPGHYPGAARFVGLGQLPPEGLRLLWAARTPVGADAVEAGRVVWDALRAPDPRGLARLAAAGTGSIPQLGRAVRRHCQELPWTSDGLALSQRLILAVLAEAPATVGQVLATLTDGPERLREPLPWMTDLMVRDALADLRRLPAPLVAGATGQHWARERQTITALGRAVLAGEVDFLSLRPQPRWVGGVQVAPPGPCWRWDEAARSAVER